MKPFPPLVYFGSDDFSAAVLSHLLTHSDFKSSLKYVVTKTPRTFGRGQRTEPTDVEKCARETTDAQIVYADSRTELDAAMDKLGISQQQPMGVLVSYGVIISDHVLDLFPHGIVNFHPSHLPAYRGPSPVETALLRGDRTIGLSIMKLTRDMDAGPVYMHAAIELEGTETSEAAYKKIVHEGAPIFYSTLRRIADDRITPSEQDHDMATYTKLIKKEDGVLRPDTKTAEMLEREVRTFLGFPKSRTTLSNHAVIVTKAHVVDNRDAAPLVLECAGHTFLAIDELIAPSGRSMSGDSFLRGYAA